MGLSLDLGSEGVRGKNRRKSNSLYSHEQFDTIVKGSDDKRGLT